LVRILVPNFPTENHKMVILAVKGLASLLNIRKEKIS
jgi:hypothetical protein